MDSDLPETGRRLHEKSINQDSNTDAKCFRLDGNDALRDFAKKLDYSDNTVSRWERAEIIPSVETLQKISELFHKT